MTVNFRFIGWNCQEGHDKVWTSFEVEDHIYCAWGRRGAKLSFKNHGRCNSFRTIDHISRLESEKLNKGYQKADNFQLFAMFPEFESRVEEELLLKILAGKVM